MKYAGVFDHAQAVVFGDFTSVDNYTLVEVVLKWFAQEMSFPVYKLTGIGYGPINHPLPLLPPAKITRIDSNTFRLCVNNVNGDIVSSEGSSNSSISKLKSSRSHFVMSLFSAIASWFVLQMIK